MARAFWEAVVASLGIPDPPAWIQLLAQLPGPFLLDTIPSPSHTSHSVPDPGSNSGRLVSSRELKYVIQRFAEDPRQEVRRFFLHLRPAVSGQRDSRTHEGPSEAFRSSGGASLSATGIRNNFQRPIACAETQPRLVQSPACDVSVLL